jgi:hypothetical protein
MAIVKISFPKYLHIAFPPGCLVAVFVGSQVAADFPPHVL